MWYKGELIPGKRVSLSHRVSKDPTLDSKRKKKKKKDWKISCSLRHLQPKILEIQTGITTYAQV